MDSINSIISGCSEEIYEFLHNVIQDAQASGAIVNIITIIPPNITDSDGTVIKGCKPKADTCPKT